MVVLTHSFTNPNKFGSPEIATMAKLSLLQKRKLILKRAVNTGITVPKLKLNNGEEIPMLGMGTLMSNFDQPALAVKDAISSGYRHIDCASSHLNEAEVGRGIRMCIEEGIVKREDLFIASKLWITDHHPAQVEPALRRTLIDLGVEYLDLYLIEYPTAFVEESEHSGEVLYSEVDIDILDTWKAMEELVQKGLVKSIGVSNFNSIQLQRLLESARIAPVLNQIEVNPYLSQKKLVEFCKDNSIAVTGYAPFRSEAQARQLIRDPRLVEISFRYNKSVPQIILRWLNQSGVVAIPKSSNKSRLQENLNVFDFRLTREEMDVIDSLNRNLRVNTFEIGKGHSEYPFNVEF